MRILEKISYTLMMPGGGVMLLGLIGHEDRVFFGGMMVGGVGVFLLMVNALWEMWFAVD